MWPNIELRLLEKKMMRGTFVPFDQLRDLIYSGDDEVDISISSSSDEEIVDGPSNDVESTTPGNSSRVKAPRQLTPLSDPSLRKRIRSSVSSEDETLADLEKRTIPLKRSRSSATKHEEETSSDEEIGTLVDRIEKDSIPSRLTDGVTSTVRAKKSQQLPRSHAGLTKNSGRIRSEQRILDVSLLGIAPGKKIEIFYQVTNAVLNTNRKVWWSCKLDKAAAALGNKWKVQYAPLPPDYPKPTGGWVQFLNEHRLIECSSNKLHFWRHEGDNFEAETAGEDRVYFDPRRFIKDERTGRDADYQELFSDGSAESSSEGFIVEDDEDDSQGEGTTSFIPPPLPDTLLVARDPLSKHKVKSLQRESVSAGLFCSKCKQLRPLDSFSSKQRKVERNSERYCLRHSSASGFDKPAVTALS